MACFHVEPLKGRDHVLVAFAGKDNPIELKFMEDGREFDLSEATAIRLQIGSQVLDSSVDTDSFDLTEDNIGRIAVSIGNITVTPKTYNMACEVEFTTETTTETTDDDGETTTETTSETKTIYFGTVRLVVRKPAM